MGTYLLPDLLIQILPVQISKNLPDIIQIGDYM